MTSVRRALVLSIADRYLLVALGLGSGMIVARLLTPEEFGLYAVALAVIGVSHMVRDFGVGSYLIQQQILQSKHVSTAFGVSLLLGGILFFVLVVSAPAIGRFYGDLRVSDALRIAAVNFLVLPFCSISVTLLRRSMRFDSLTIISLSSAVTGIVATLLAVWAGLGPNGMALGSVVANVVTGIGAWIALRDLSVFRPALSEWRAVVGFGGQSALTNLVVSLSSNINDLVLAKVLGFAPAAMVSRAQGLPLLFQRELMRAIQVVAYPAFAQAQRDGDDVERKWTSALGALTALAWPFFGYAALMALELIRFMFGDQWDEAVVLVPIFCAAGAVQVLAALVQEFLIAKGRIDLNTGFVLSFQPLRAGFIIAVAIVTRSLTACAWAYFATALVHVPLAYVVKSRCNNFYWPLLMSQLRASFFVSVVTLALPLGVCAWYGFHRSLPMSLPTFLLTTAATAATWLCAVLLLKHPLSLDPAFVTLLKVLRLRHV